MDAADVQGSGGGEQQQQGSSVPGASAKAGDGAGAQQHNKPIELSSNEMIERYVNYLHENPVKAGCVELAEEYVHCSAPIIAGKPGLLRLEEL